MKGLKDFRRSLNKDRTSGGRPRAAVPATFTNVQNAVSIQPPKKVIRATRDYKAQSPQELSFHKGDFFHVLNDDGTNADWLEATNPATGARGLVPAAYFDVLTKSRPVIAGPAGNPSTSGMLGPASGGATATGVAPSSRAGGAAMVAKGGGGLYAIVKYDFVAERADELGAKAGESIIIIAQSNFEWFVAKPIGRLGGPGLIPVAFVEIKDLATGQVVDNVQELIEKGIIPKVEEWKKMTADYKKNTIPLGRLDFPAQPANAQPQVGVGPGTTRASPRMIVAGPSSLPAEPASPMPPPKDETLISSDYGDQANTLPPGMPPGEPLPAGLIMRATVDSFHYEQGDYWFRVRAMHIAGTPPASSNIPPPPSSAPFAPPGQERDLILYRLYEDFYEFQIALLDHFPSEAGRETDDQGRPSQRILPLMPGPLDHVDDLITNQRRIDLDTYIQELCLLPEYILRSELVRLFFEPRPGDHCTTYAVNTERDQLDVGPTDSSEALSQDYAYLSGNIHQGGETRREDATIVGQSNGTSKYAEHMPVGRRVGDDISESVGALSVNGPTESNGRGLQQSAASIGVSGAKRSESSLHVNSHDSKASGHAIPHSTIPPGPGVTQNTPFIKIKIYNRANDDLVAIRVPPTVTYSALLDKVRERLGTELSVLRYKEASPEPGSSGLMRISDDEDLREWLDSGAKMSLYADVK